MIDLVIKITKQKKQSLTNFFNKLEQGGYVVKVDGTTKPKVIKRLIQERSTRKKYIAKGEWKEFFNFDNSKFITRNNSLRAASIFLLSKEVKEKFSKVKNLRIAIPIGFERPIFWVYVNTCRRKKYCYFNLYKKGETIFGDRWLIVKFI